jgi:PII-like signaling protein
MAAQMVKISIYINEADEWHHRPLHTEILRMLREHGLAGGTVLRGVAGFTRKGVQSAGLVDAGGKLPLVIEFIDTAEDVERILPTIREMTGHRLVTSEKVTVLNE